MAFLQMGELGAPDHDAIQIETCGTSITDVPTTPCESDTLKRIKPWPGKTMYPV